jgi:hypothetical protein
MRINDIPFKRHLILASVVLAPYQGLWDVEPLEKHKPTKREKQYIYSNETYA